jgi:acetyltransferase-like isoleucine patch superfamily enzyme
VREFRATSYGNGEFRREDLAAVGDNVIIEHGALILKPERVRIGSDTNDMVIGDHTWIGQFCYINSAGGVEIGSRVGVGPYVKMMSSRHREEGRDVPILLSDLEFAPIRVKDDCDIGIGAIILPGTTVGRGSIVGAGAVVTRDVEPYSIVAGVPARKIGERPPAG